MNMSIDEQLNMASGKYITPNMAETLMYKGNNDVKLTLINNPSTPLFAIEYLRQEDNKSIKLAAINECNFRKNTNELVKELNLLEFKDIFKNLEPYKDNLKTLNYLVDHKDITSKVVGEICSVSEDLNLQEKCFDKLKQLPIDSDKKIFDMYEIQKENFEYSSRNKFRP